MKILITGASGQLGQALLSSKPSLINKRHVEIIPFTHSDLDLTNHLACREVIEQIKPDWLINAAAYTAVDKAESEANLAFAVNSLGPASLAEALDENGGQMLHLSTDFVFNGQQSTPYEPEDPISPQSIYGQSKAEGEKKVLDALGERALLLRTSWVYGPVGKNFLLTMLKLHDLKVKRRETLDVVADQIGCPTCTSGLATACWKLVESREIGLQFPQIHHWSDTGVASWFDFAVAIGDLAVDLGILSSSAQVNPIKTASYPTAAKRPNFSLLDSWQTRAYLKLDAMHWRKALHSVLSILKSKRFD